LLTLSFRLHLDIAIGRATVFSSPTLGTTKGGFVERFVEFAAKVENDGGVRECSASRHGQNCGRAQKFTG